MLPGPLVPEPDRAEGTGGGCMWLGQELVRVH